MVRIKLVAGNLKSPIAQIGDECGRIADAAEREEFLSPRILFREMRMKRGED